ncbi:hypothetical protein GPECTOR_25g364 [Gonium pectorale]|uniref:Uncharacterized protein n=1 Tax=Gonium pectorale TaxID=33097 RepID=A0A150GHE2_GONPE|nr:hypothetical protein GPECTOR_25g364 [Gonium pectorale]|eukprot:KXZ48780.1 hypothetical protein GPECTOR_25g364 [Gonium pectorale]
MRLNPDPEPYLGTNQVCHFVEKGEKSGDKLSTRTITAIRLERARHEAVSAERSEASQSPYMAQVTAYRERSRKLDPSRLAQDPRVQDLAALPGVRRSLPTNILDGGPHVNTNIIRYKRDADFVSTTPYDGGPKYNDDVCINNWVQERRDRTYKSGFHPREIRRSGRFDTEYSARFKPSDPEYVHRVVAAYTDGPRFSGLHRIGPTGIADPVFPKNAAETSGQHLFYVKDGFGGAPNQDHTTEGKRGAFWVGTAPHAPHDTVTHSTMRAETLEFQRRCRSEDPRSMVLMSNKPLIHESESTQRIRDELIATNAFTRGWRTIYQTEHKDYSRRPATVA